jgi:hypothetical protein
MTAEEARDLLIEKRPQVKAVAARACRNRMRHATCAVPACDRVAPQVHIGDMQWEGVLDFQR